MRWWLNLLISWVLIAVAFYLTTLVVPGIHVSGGVGGYLVVALIFGLINAVLGPVLRFLTFPLRIMTLGLFSIVLNAFLLWLVDLLTTQLRIEHFFWDGVIGAIVLGIISWALNLVVHQVRR
jgi:putative membrane protein